MKSSPPLSIDSVATLVVRRVPQNLGNNAAELVRGGEIVFATDYFLLNGFIETDSEMTAPYFTLGGAQISSGGRNVKMYSYAGTVTRTKYSDGGTLASSGDYPMTLHQLDGAKELANAYLKYLDPGVCAKNDHVVELRYRDQVRRGYLTKLKVSMRADFEGASGLSFSMFVIDEYGTIEPDVSSFE